MLVMFVFHVRSLYWRAAVMHKDGFMCKVRVNTLNTRQNTQNANVLSISTM